MIGRARTGAAVTVLNALFDGIGAAVAIDLGLEARVTVYDGAAGGPRNSVRPASSETPLVRATLEAARRAYRIEPTSSVALELDSEIPWSVGLKSSSAVGGAVLLAAARAVGHPASPEAIARRAAEVARGIGQSATGALDDALACLSPGLWAADTRSGEILLRAPAPEAEVVLSIPPGTHPPSPALAARLRGRGPANGLELLRSEGPWKAMEATSRALEPLLGVEVPDRTALREAGALATTVSGLGPTVAIFVPVGGAAPVLDRLTGRPGQRLVRGLRREGSAGSGT